MSERKQNYYGVLCTEMYEILHKEAPRDELDFYLSYVQRGKKILEPLCGSGRPLVPIMERGFDIRGMDLSEEMLDKLRRKAPGAKVVRADVAEYFSAETFDYIFISSGSVSLFTDIGVCKRILKKLRGLLAPKGKLVFAVDTVACRCSDNADYKIAVSVKTEEGFDLVLKSRNRYDAGSQTQFSPGIYELYDGGKLLQSEQMDFRTHLYKFGEMEKYLKEAGFGKVTTYCSFQKEPAVDDRCEAFLFECGVD